MPCDFKTMPGAILCSRGRGRGMHPRCQMANCRERADYQCDYTITYRETCDRYLCRAHAIDRGAGVQFCPIHAAVDAELVP